MIFLFFTQVYGSYAVPIDQAERANSPNPEHTHRWTVYIRAIPTSNNANPNDQHLCQWLKKVQFKLHETYAQSVRTVEQPPFEVTETGWGEFEVQMKLFFVPEANEKAQTLWHGLKLHPFGDDVEGKRERREPVTSQVYEEVVFTEPARAFHDILATPYAGPGAYGQHQRARKLQDFTTELPDRPTKDNIYSKQEEEKESAWLREVDKQIEEITEKEKANLTRIEEILAELKEDWSKKGAPPAA